MFHYSDIINRFLVKTYLSYRNQSNTFDLSVLKNIWKGVYVSQSGSFMIKFSWMNYLCYWTAMNQKTNTILIKGKSQCTTQAGLSFVASCASMWLQFCVTYFVWSNSCDTEINRNFIWSESKNKYNIDQGQITVYYSSGAFFCSFMCFYVVAILCYLFRVK